MKAKDYLITWLWTSLLMYFLYDVVWVLADHEEFNRLLEEGCTILWIDLCYCFLFSIYNLGFGTLLLKSRLLRFFQKKKQCCPKRFIGTMNMRLLSITTPSKFF